MAAALLRLRAAARLRLRAWVVLALLVGVAGGAVLASLAAADRTESAYDRFRVWSSGADLTMFNAADPIDFSRVRRLPEVAVAGEASFAWLVGENGESDLDPVYTVDAAAGTIDRPKLLEGRRPDPTKVDEASITPPAKRITGLKVGSSVTLRALSPDQLESAFEGRDLEPAGPTVTVHIVGIEAGQGEFVTDSTLRLTPAFGREYGDQIATVDLLAVRLKRGAADLASFKNGVERIAGDTPVSFGTADEVATDINRTLHVQAVALRTFGLLAALASLVILAQALGREAAEEAVDHPALRALGVTRPQLWATSVVRTLFIAVPGAVLAAVVSAVAAPLLVFGLGRETDPHPAGWVDARTVLAGMLGLVVVLVLAGAWPAWRVSRWWTEGSQTAAGVGALPSRAVGSLARAGVPASTLTGVRMALEPGRGRTAVPTRAALVGTTVSLAAVLAAFTFGSSLHRLLTTPRLYGWDWDAVLGSPFDEDTSDRVIPALTDERAVAEASSMSYAEMTVAGARARAVAFEPVKGSVLPPVVEGRAPQDETELALGTKTLHATGRSIGDTVDVVVGDRHEQMRIVGRSVLPSVGGSDAGIALGEGILVTGDGLRRLVPDAPVDLYAVRYSDAVPRREAEAFAERLGFGVFRAEPPKGVADFARVDKLPGILSALLVVVAAGTLGHTLMTGVRRRRRDLAILKTLGFVRRQVRAAVGWQATSLVLVALICAMPLGLAAGQWAWRVFAGELGIVPEPVVPLVTVLLVAPATVVAANLLAALPGRSAAAVQPAMALRSE